MVLSRFLRFAHGLSRSSGAVRRTPRRRLGCELLEDRLTPSTIVWTNRGTVANDADGFAASFGAEAAAARNVVDAAIADWQRIIVNFNTANFSTPGNPNFIPANQFHLTLSAADLDGQGLGSAIVNVVDNDGKPRSATILIDSTGATPGVLPWFFDPTPRDHSEFTDRVSAFSGLAPGNPNSLADDRFDLYTTVAHELMHGLGLAGNGSLRLNRTSSSFTLTNTGMTEPGKPGRLLSFDGPSVDLLLTTTNGGFNSGTPSHFPASTARIAASAAFPNGLIGAVDLMFHTGERAVRRLPSNLDALFLKDVYDYTVVEPEQFGTLYARLDANGVLTVRGDPTPVFTPLEAPEDIHFPDHIRISRAGSTITVSVDVGGDRLPNRQARDAFVSTFNVNDITSINVLATEGSDVTIENGLGVVVNATGAAFSTLTFEGREGTDTIHVTNTLIESPPFFIGLNILFGSTINYTGFAQLAIEARGGADTINVQGAAVDGLFLRGGDGDDTINFSTLARDLSGLASIPTLSVFGDAGHDQLILEDSDSTSSHNYGITSSRVTRGNSRVVDYQTVENLILDAGDGNDSITIESVAALTLVEIKAGLGNDTFTLGLNNSLAGIQGTLDLRGNSGTDLIILNDQAGATALNYTIRNERVERSAGPTLRYSSAEGVTLNAPNSGNTFHVETLNSETPVTLNANGGNDTIVVSPTAQAFANLFGTLTVIGGAGTDTLTLQNQASTTLANLSLTGNSVLRAGNTPLSITYGSLDAVTVNLGSGADNLVVEAVALPISLTINTGPGDDRIDVAQILRTLDVIQGQLTVNGEAGSDVLLLNDTARTAGATVTFTPTTITRGSALPINYSGFESLNFQAGSGADTLNASQVSIPVVLIGNDGNDTLVGGSAADQLGVADSDTLTGGPGGDIIRGGPGNDTNVFTTRPDLFGDDVDLGTGEDGVLIRGTNRGDVIHISRQSTPSGIQITAQINGEAFVSSYQNGETVTVLAGAGNDVVVIDATAGESWKAVLDGQDGNDLLVGGARNDVLLGGRGNDTLLGGDGADDLVGGDGHDHLQGGNDDDRLDGGRGRDTFVGGAGADRIFARDGEIDELFADVADLLLDLDRRDHVIGR